MTVVLAGISFSEIPIAQLNDASWNARKSFDEVALQELAASIREHGVQVPLIVREVADAAFDPEAVIREQDRVFEIVAGHRRFRAAQRIGVEALPCIVRQLDEDQAREIGLIDNLQREDVPAMEEAAAFEELLKKLGSIADVAARVGKEQGYVAKRLKLCTLTLAAQDALLHSLITVDHALVLARLGQDEQDAALKWCLDRSAGVKVSVDKVIEERLARQKEREAKKDSYRWPHTWEPASVQALKDHIASESGVALVRAPWDLSDGGLLEDTPACDQCPQNTKANAPLFGDLDIGEAKCTDTGCFREKTNAFVQVRLKQAEPLIVDQTVRSVLRVSWKATSAPPRFDARDKGVKFPTLLLMQVFKVGQWTEAKKKSCEHVRPAVTVDWSDANQRGYMGRGEKLRKPGEILSVCIEPKCKVHPKDWAQPKSTPARAVKLDEKAERERRERENADRIAESKIRLEIVSRAVAGVTKLPGEVVRALALYVLPGYVDGLRPYEALLPGIRKILATAKTDSLEFARAVALASIDTDEFQVRGGWGVKEKRAEFVKAIARLGYDASKAWDEKEQRPEKKPAKKAAKKARKAAKK